MEKIIDLHNIVHFSFDELFKKLRRVELKGITDKDNQSVKIYEQAKFKIKTYNPDEILEKLYTPQPKVYTERLNYLENLVEIFEKKGLNHPCDLTECYDYTKTITKEGESKEETGVWTIIPPVIEILKYPVKIDYTQFIEGILPAGMEILPELNNQKVETTFPIICDGDHRIYYALKNNRPITVVEISEIKSGYPYYAFPQRYWKKELATRADGELSENAIFDKIHILSKVNEKKLYRLFPSGGIYSGDVRPDAIK